MAPLLNPVNRLKSVRVRPGRRRINEIKRARLMARIDVESDKKL
jgi:hypothetical protein